jgi:hypothetical protein
LAESADPIHIAARGVLACDGNLAGQCEKESRMILPVSPTLIESASKRSNRDQRQERRDRRKLRHDRRDNRGNGRNGHR